MGDWPCYGWQAGRNALVTQVTQRTWDCSKADGTQVRAVLLVCAWLIKGLIDASCMVVHSLATNSAAQPPMSWPCATCAQCASAAQACCAVHDSLAAAPDNFG